MKKQFVMGSISVLGLTLFSFSLFKLNVSLHFGGSSQSNPTATAASDTPVSNQQNQKEIQPRTPPPSSPTVIPISTPLPHSRVITTPPPVQIPTPQVSFSIKQVGNQFYRAVIPPGRWVDTGIPVVANVLVAAVDVEDDPRHKFIAKVGGVQFYSYRNVLNNQWGSSFSVNVGETKQGQPYLIVSYDFKDTVKIRVDDEGANEPLTLTFYLDRYVQDALINDSGHMALHAEAEDWYAKMKARLERQ